MPTIKIKPTAKKSVRTAKTSAPAVTEKPWHYEIKNTETKNDPALDISNHQPIYQLTNPLISQSTRQPSRPALRCILFALTIVVFPFIAWPWTFSTTEFPKFIFLSVAVGVGLIIVVKEYWLSGSFTLIPRHPYVVTGLATLIAMAVSASRSGARFPGIFGSPGTESLSILGLLLLGLWALLAYAAGRENFTLPYGALTASGSLLALITLVSLLGFNPYYFAGISGFNPAGTTTSAALLATATLALAIGGALNAQKKYARILYAIAGLAPLTLIVGSGFRVPLILTAVALAVLGLGALRLKNRLTPAALAVILLNALVALALAIWPLTTFLTTPLEVGPSQQETWSIALKTLALHPLLGSGPATFGADYLKFRSLPILQTPFWNVTFDWGASAALTFLATLGWLGAGLLLLTVLSVLFFFLIFLFKANRLAITRASDVALLAAGLSLFVGVWLAPAPLAVRFMLDTILGLMLARSGVRPINLISQKIVPPLVSALTMVFILLLFLTQARRTAAEAYAALGIRAFPNLTAAQEKLNRAAQFDPLNDGYLRLLTDSLRFEFTKKLAAAPTGNPQTQLAEISQRADAALTAARRATELAPDNAANWNTLGNVYLELAPIAAGAAQAGSAAFEQARALSPADPALLTNLGLAQALQARTTSGEAAVKLLETATATLHRAIEIRPDFSNARWFLAQIYEEKGEIGNAIEQLEKIVELNPQNEQAKARLEELRAKEL